jgi:hypothetical protein
MIQANELRIGSKFMGVGMIETVNSIEPYSEQKGYEYLIRVIDNGNQYKPVDMNPIPLTPAILVACGFVKTDSSNEYWNHWVLKNGWHISESLHDEPSAGVVTGLCYYSEDYIQIKYLHQLQNLYFALTGKEITVNL